MTYVLGLKPHRLPDDRLLAVQWKAGQPPAHAVAVDHFTGGTIGLDGNDRYGVCGPTSADNHRRITTRMLTGTEQQATQQQVFDLYRAAGNPSFDPATDADDNGVDMATLCKALRDVGLGGHRALAFGRLADTSDASVYAGIDLFGAVLFAVDLEVAQQAQTEQGLWDYHRSGTWGGHAIVAGAYDSAKGTVDVGTWGRRVQTTAAFRAHQLAEVWVPLWPETVGTTRFEQAVDLGGLAADFTALTGQPFPVVPPSPAPTPVPAPPAPTPTPVDDSVALEPDIAARVDQLAARAHLDRAGWLDKHLRHYLHL